MVPHSGELGGTFGWSNLRGVDDNTHIAFGGTAGYNATARAQVFGEYLYSPEGSFYGLHGKSQWLGGGVRYHFYSRHRISPFVVAAGGYYTESVGEGGYSYAEHGGYVGGGGGISVLFGHIVVRPEVRYERAMLTGIAGGGENLLVVTASVLYQFDDRK
jgi:hypothetical protein